MQPFFQQIAAFPTSARHITFYPALLLLTGLLLTGCGSGNDDNNNGNGNLPRERTIGNFERVATFSGPMPTGVTVSQSGRIFVCFPRWDDPVAFTVAEVRNGQATAYPNADINRLDLARPADTLISVQSVVVDAQDRLWLLDTGSINMEPIVANAPKLIAIDLNTNQIVQTIRFPGDVVLSTSYINDVRFDLRKGQSGVAYITDSSDMGPNAIIVVDLATGTSRRQLNDHPSTKGEANFVPFPEGEELRVRRPGQTPQTIRTGSDGIALSSDGSRLYYCPLASRRLYSVSTDALLGAGDASGTVVDEGEKPAADGLEFDAQGRLYSTAYEHNGVVRRRTDGTYETLLHDERVIWPDTLSVSADGYLYLINNQLNRRPIYHNGEDQRVRSFSLLRMRIDGTPVRL